MQSQEEDLKISEYGSNHTHLWKIWESYSLKEIVQRYLKQLSCSKLNTIPNWNFISLCRQIFFQFSYKIIFILIFLIIYYVLIEGNILWIFGEWNWFKRNKEWNRLHFHSFKSNYIAWVVMHRSFTDAIIKGSFLSLMLPYRDIF